MKHLADSYIAKQGDTWDHISYQVYGSEYHMTELIQNNRKYIDTIIFSGGEVLKIPDIKTDVAILAPWRQ